MKDIGNNLGTSGLYSIIVVILCIGVCWWVLLSLRFEKLVRTPGSTQAKLLHLILSIVLGYQTGLFLIDYVRWTSLVKYLFE